MKWQKIKYTEERIYQQPSKWHPHGYTYYDRRFVFADSKLGVCGNTMAIKFKDGIIKKSVLCDDDTSDNDKIADFKPKLYLGKSKWVYEYEHSHYVYPKTSVNHEDIEIMDFDNVKIEIVYPKLKIGQFIDLAGIRDSNSFRKIINVNDTRVFCEKWIMTKNNELKMEYTSSDNGIEKIKGIYNEEELNKGNFVYDHDFSDKEILKIIKEKY